MEYIEILKKRRSVRSFLDKPVEKEKVDQMMSTLNYLPSSRSIFPAEYIVVDNKEILSKLADCRDHGATFLKNAPLAIIVMANAQKSDVWVEDASIASTFLLLSAFDLGLASCWVQIRKRKLRKISTDAIISEMLDIPPTMAILSIIAVGYADESSIKPKIKHSDQSKIHYNHYLIR